MKLFPIKKIEHFMITRINIGMYSSTPKSHLATLESKNFWMKNKMVAMKKNLVSSIKYQTNKNFRIVWLVDDETPPEFIEQIKELAKEVDANIIMDKWNKAYNIAEGTSICGNWVEQFKPMIRSNTIAITRFDSDDIMTRNFMERVRSHFEDPPVCIDFWVRLTLDSRGDLYLVQAIPKGTGRCTPVVTLIEEKEKMKTPYCLSHFKLWKMFPIKIYNELLWCKPERNVPMSVMIRKMEEKRLEDIEGFEGIGL